MLSPKSLLSLFDAWFLFLSLLWGLWSNSYLVGPSLWLDFLLLSWPQLSTWSSLFQASVVLLSSYTASSSPCPWMFPFLLRSAVSQENSLQKWNDFISSIITQYLSHKGSEEAEACHIFVPLSSLAAHRLKSSTAQWKKEQTALLKMSSYFKSLS